MKTALLREALDRLSAPAVAAMIDRGWLTGDYPLEITKLGKRELQVFAVDRGKRYKIVRSPRGRFVPGLRSS